MSVDSDEEYQVGRSWISMRGLQHAADIKTVYSGGRDDSPSGLSSLNSSVSTEPVPNPLIHASPSFSNLHGGYMGVKERLADGKSEVTHRRDSSANTTRGNTQRSYEELSELRLELNRTQHEVSRLNLELVKSKQEHKLELQRVYAHHERKVQKLRQELDSSRLSSQISLLESKLKDQLLSSRQELERVRNDYEEHMEEMQVEHELELQSKEEEFAKILKEEVTLVENKLHNQIESMEKRHKTEMRQFCREEKPCELKEQEVSRFRRVPKKRETPEVTVETSAKEIEVTQDEKEKQIQDQAAQIEDLRSQLSAAMRRKPTEAKSIRASPFGILDTSEDLSLSQNLESELKQLISQIE